MNFLKTLLEATLKNLKSDSGFLKINYKDVAKLVRNAVVVGLGSTVAFALANISGVDLGNETITMIFVLLGTAGLEFIQRLLKDNTNEV